jgi:hypothetical protein
VTYKSVFGDCMKMNLFFFLFSFTAVSSLFAQEIPSLQPAIGRLIDLSPEGEIEFYTALESCDELFETINQTGDIEHLSEEEKHKLGFCEGNENYYDVMGPGCSWYCGGGMDTLSASSFLKPGKTASYEPKNIHDLNYGTAWVEGVSGHGIGEFVIYHIPPNNPRINKLIIVNGYVKSDKTWKENSRVKKLKMYLDDKPYAFLILQDVKNEQIFTVDLIGYSDRKDYNALLIKPWYSIKFEIIEVYPGTKYQDTAITEIYFDGIDVH